MSNTFTSKHIGSSVEIKLQISCLVEMAPKRNTLVSMWGLQKKPEPPPDPNPWKRRRKNDGDSIALEQQLAEVMDQVELQTAQGSYCIAGCSLAPL